MLLRDSREGTNIPGLFPELFQLWKGFWQHSRSPGGSWESQGWENPRFPNPHPEHPILQEHREFAAGGGTEKRGKKGILEWEKSPSYEAFPRKIKSRDVLDVQIPKCGIWGWREGEFGVRNYPRVGLSAWEGFSFPDPAGTAFPGSFLLFLSHPDPGKG